MHIVVCVYIFIYTYMYIIYKFVYRLILVVCDNYLYCYRGAWSKKFRDHCFRGPYCHYHHDWSKECWEVAGLYWGQVTGSGQSQWFGGGEIQPHSGQCKRSLLLGLKEFWDMREMTGNSCPVRSPSGRVWTISMGCGETLFGLELVRTSRKDRQERARWPVELIQLLLASKSSL
jgi:hypothetical protein